MTAPSLSMSDERRLAEFGQDVMAAANIAAAGFHFRTLFTRFLADEVA